MVNKKYPAYYKKSLGDGYRLGVGGEMITKFHDYFALEQVIFEAYSILADANGFTAAKEKVESFFGDYEANGEKIKEAHELLSNFLTGYPEATLKVKPRFNKALKELPPPLDDTDKKDNSPKKNVNTNKEVATGSLRE